jgi:hypothetical protein
VALAAFASEECDSCRRRFIFQLRLETPNAGGFLMLGRQWRAAAAFPFAFRIFLVPLPDDAANFLENASMLASAEVTSLLFNARGILCRLGDAIV